MSVTKSITVKNSDVPFWERGAEQAKARGMSMSAYITYLLRQDVTEQGLRRSVAKRKTPAELLREAQDEHADRLREIERLLVESEVGEA